MNKVGLHLFYWTLMNGLKALKSSRVVRIEVDVIAGEWYRQNNN